MLVKPSNIKSLATVLAMLGVVVLLTACSLPFVGAHADAADLFLALPKKKSLELGIERWVLTATGPDDRIVTVEAGGSETQLTLVLNPLGI